MQNEIIAPAEIPQSCILHPDPILAAERLSVSIVQRFFEKVNKTETCWLWTGGNDRTGGVICRGARGPVRDIRSHQVSWLIHFGPLPFGWITRSCENNLCVNPLHLVSKHCDP